MRPRPGSAVHSPAVHSPAVRSPAVRSPAVRSPAVRAPAARTLCALLVAAALAVTLAQVAPAMASPRDPAPIRGGSGPIVAVGDSFMSGLGAGDYRIGAGGCRRSQRSIARLVAIRAHRLLIDLSCPDARLMHHSDGPLNLDRQIAAVPHDAAVVLVSAGGNDLGFAAVTGPCLIAGTRTCYTAVAAARDQLPAVTRNLTRALLHIRLRAPRARIITVGYPPLVRFTPMCDLWLGMSRIEWLTDLQHDLDSAIATAAVRAAARYVDWPPEADQHTVCDGEPWFVIGGATTIDEVLHPTYEAVRAMAIRLHPHVPRSPAAVARSAAP